jgi:hypothetical protein
MSDTCQENAIEWINGDKEVWVSFSQRKFITKLKKYAKSNSIYIYENKDGSVYAKIPLSWVKISPPRKGREFSEEEKVEAAERLRIAREKRQKENLDNINNEI